MINMNLHSKFLLILTAVISLIIVFSFWTVYLLYEQSRKADERKYLLAEATEAVSLYFRLPTTKDITDSLKASPLLEFAGSKAVSVIILDAEKKMIYASPDTIHIDIHDALLEEIKHKTPYYFTTPEASFVGIYYSHLQETCYAIVSVTNLYNDARLEQLRNILIVVAVASIIFIFLFSFYYVFVVTAPLVKLSKQMRHISETNLTKRVEVVKGNFKTNEIVQVATNLNFMLDRLQRAFENQKNFARHASHELRTPLANMLLQTEHAIERNLSANEMKRILLSLKEDEMQLIGLINSLLQFSQYDHIENLELSPQLRLDDLIYQSISFARKNFKDIHIQFEFITSPEKETDISVNGHEELLRAAFNNLIKNAYIYAVDKTVRIFIDSKEEKVEVIVENTGPGLTKEEQERMFVPFFRGANAKTGKGFGLGLPIVHRIVRIHDAQIMYQFTDDMNNRFIIQFKRKKNPPESGLSE